MDAHAPSRRHTNDPSFRHAVSAAAPAITRWTLTLDVLEEFMRARHGARSFLRLDGATHRITREMDVRSFNAPGAPAWMYLISTKATNNTPRSG